MLIVKNISHFYLNNHGRDKRIVFNDLSFEVKNGEFVALLGHSGCGKTTLVNIVAGYTRPVDGHIIIDDNDVTAHPGKNRIVIHQESDVFEWMSVVENIRLVAKKKDIEYIEKYIRLAHLDNFHNTYPKQLSGGMKKRLSLARALAAEPEFIIMDEPFGSLDYQTKEELYQEFLTIVKLTEKSVLLVTHDIEEAILLADRVIVLSGTPAIIKQETTIPFVRSREPNVKESKEFIELKHMIRSGYNTLE